MRALVFVTIALVLLGSSNGCSSGGSAAGQGGGGHSGSAAKKKAFSECCLGDSECESGFCSSKGQICSMPCTTDEECPIEPKSGERNCSQSHGACEGERIDVTCEHPAGAGGTGGGVSGDGGTSSSGGVAGSGGSSGDGGETGSGGVTPSGGGSSTGGTTVTASPRLIHCAPLGTIEPFNNTTSSDICSCDGDTNTGAVSYRGEGCGQGNAELFCCGDPGYPAAGSCTCYQKRSWQCTEAFIGTSNAFCQCWYYGKIVNYASQVPTTSCDLTTKTYATRCYVTDVSGGQRCQCDARALPAGARVVSSCSTAEAAQVTVQTSCDADQKSVTTCSTSLYVPPASGSGCGSGCSGTQCVGDGLCCVYVCENNACKQNCNF